MKNEEYMKRSVGSDWIGVRSKKWKKGNIEVRYKDRRRFKKYIRKDDQNIYGNSER